MPTVYSSAQWPPSQPMCMHHEQSYALEVPGLMLFACLTAPHQGGATGVADAATVLEELPTALTERFEREGWLLTRSYNDEIGSSLIEAFGTDERDAVERYYAPTRSSSHGNPTGPCAPGSAATP